MEKEQMKVIACQCGRVEHYIEANYCVACGKVLGEEKPQIVTFPLMNQMILEQVVTLAVWNKENINDNPEQVRRNVETIIYAFTCMPSCQFPPTPDAHL
nr:hypothetical protein [Brevibacillus laterosporus]